MLGPEPLGIDLADEHDLSVLRRVDVCRRLAELALDGVQPMLRRRLVSSRCCACVQHDKR
jgi:hypothetical protein